MTKPPGQVTRLSRDMLHDLDAVIRASFAGLMDEQRQRNPAEPGVTTTDIVEAAAVEAAMLCRQHYDSLVRKLIATRVPLVMAEDKAEGWAVSQPLLPGLEQMPTIFSVPRALARSGGPLWVTLGLTRVAQLSRARLALDNDITGRITAATPVRRADDICRALGAADDLLIVEVLRRRDSAGSRPRPGAAASPPP